MRIDPEEFSRHYATLSDDALLAIDPADLVDVARERYQQELRNRKLDDYDDNVEASGEDSAGAGDDADSEEPSASEDTGGNTGDDDEWKEHAICACSFAQSQDAATPASHAAEADAALTDAGVPCFIDSDPGDATTGARPEYRVMIPASLRLLAESILDKDIFNAALEGDWKTHFEELTDEDLLALNADELCAGMLDRAARLKKTFARELAHRGIRR